MPKKSADTLHYKSLMSELDDIKQRLELGELDIDDAVTCYARGLEIVKLLEEILKNAKNKVSKYKADAGIDA